MNSKDYILNHDYGYCSKLNNFKVNKVALRNIADLNAYIADIINCNIVGNLSGMVLEFDDNDSMFKIVVQKCTKIN